MPSYNVCPVCGKDIKGGTYMFYGELIHPECADEARKIMLVKL